MPNKLCVLNNDVRLISQFYGIVLAAKVLKNFCYVTRREGGRKYKKNLNIMQNLWKQKTKWPIALCQECMFGSRREKL